MLCVMQNTCDSRGADDRFLSSAELSRQERQTTDNDGLSHM